MSNVSNKMWDELNLSIKKSKRILLSTHINPDGDGLGSEIAFYYFLINQNKNCRIVNISNIPYNYKILDPDSIIETYDSGMDEWLNSVDLTILFDIGDFNRIGKIGDFVKKTSTLACIDHHPPKDNHPFKINIIDINAPATGYMIWKYFQYINYTKHNLSILIANALYASVVTDTGSFKYQSTTSDTHIMASYLLDCGVNGYNIQKEIYEQQRFSQLMLLGKVINSLEFSKNRKVVWTVITQNMLKEANASDDDAGGFTEYLRMIENVEVSFMIREYDQFHRINFRSSGSVIINDIAQFFGGGGHIFAAGARIDGMETKKIVDEIIKLIDIKLPGEFNGN